MELVGYARVSTIDQDSSTQINTLKAAGCTTLFTEKKSGSTLNERTALEECMTYLKKGDTLVVTRIDRLTRSILDLQILLAKLRDKKVHLKATEQPIDTSNASGKAFLDMLGVFAEFETNLRRERQLEGIAKAKKEGKYKGRQATALAKAAWVIQLIKQGYTRQSVAKQLDIGIASVYRILKAHKQTNSTPPLPGSPSSNKKIAVVEVSLLVENNSKFVRGKSESRQRIEESCFAPFSMTKKDKDGSQYTLKIPYQTNEELDEIINKMIEEAGYLADLKNGFVEMSVHEPETEKCW